MTDETTRPSPAEADEFAKAVARGHPLDKIGQLRGLERKPGEDNLAFSTRIKDGMKDSITCPRCGMTSYHPRDVTEGYCAKCHDWTTKEDKP
jgi:hypothetical protein